MDKDLIEVTGVNLFVTPDDCICTSLGYSGMNLFIDEQDFRLGNQHLRTPKFSILFI